jgi:hypothetical protein
MESGTTTLTPDLLARIDAYWRAANYLSVGQIYLYDNPLLKRPLAPADIKHMLLGHWGTTPGQNFIYVHLNRAIKKYDLDMIYVSGPGHGGPAVVGNTYGVAACACTISRNGPARFRVKGPTLHGSPAEPRLGSSTGPFSSRQVFWL